MPSSPEEFRGKVAGRKSWACCRLLTLVSGHKRVSSEDDVFADHHNVK